jgi:hypothetical protein
MPGDVSFWPIEYGWTGPASKAGRAKESGPSGPEIRATIVNADSDVFVVAPAHMGGHVLFRSGDVIPQAYAGFPRVPAVGQNGVLVPGS